jgi:hypothetical protein
MDIHDLVPKNKGDLKTADAAIRAGYPAVEPIIADLIEWLQDLNWPVAKKLLPFLQSIGEPLAPHIWRVLGTDDPGWKYWVLTTLIPTLPAESATQFRRELERLGYEPSLGERSHELDEQAREVLDYFGWLRSDD